MEMSRVFLQRRTRKLVKKLFEDLRLVNLQMEEALQSAGRQLFWGGAGVVPDTLGHLSNLYMSSAFVLLDLISMSLGLSLLSFVQWAQCYI